MHVNLGSFTSFLRTSCIVLHYLCIAALLFFAVWNTPVLAQQGSVTSKLSSSSITKDESVTLEVVAIGLDAELDTSALNKDFEVVGRSSSREVNTVMDANQKIRTTSVVTWALQLLPRKIGLLTVPAVTVGSLKSQVHTLTVNALPTGASRDVFLEAHVDTTTPWVQSQVLLTLKVYQGLDIVEGGLGSPQAENLIVERLGDDETTKEFIDGREYDVTIRRFALLPQKSGELLIDPITLSISILADPQRSRGFFAPTRKLTRRTDGITLNVKPRPESGSSWWLPAKAVQLTGSWIGDVDAAQVDTPLTRSIILRASGVSDSQLPDIETPTVEGASLYAEQPERRLGSHGQGLLSEVALKWAVIPQKAGEFILPEVAIDWFNTNTGKIETVRLAEERIQVKASSVSSVSQPSVPTKNEATQLSLQNESNKNLPVDLDDSSSDTLAGNTLIQSQLQHLESSVTLWKRLMSAMLVLWLATIAFFYWQYRKRKYPGQSRSKATLGAVRNAARDTVDRVQPLAGVISSCKEGDLKKVKSSLIEWSERQWPDDSPKTLGALAARLPSGEARESIRQLDAALYSKESSAANEVSKTMLSALPDQLKTVLTGDQGLDARDTKQVTSEKGLPAL